ncbi:hypothetical protein ACTVMJ_04365, partial [Serratia marcescens]
NSLHHANYLTRNFNHMRKNTNSRLFLRLTHLRYTHKLNPSTATTSPQTTGTLFNNLNRMTG